MKKISLIAAAMFAAVTSMPAAHAEYTPNVNFSGYLRSGIQHGSSAFTAKRFVTQVGRLGNENDTFADLGFGSDVVKVEDTTFSVFAMFGHGEDNNDNDWNQNIAVRQLYVNVNGLIDSDKDANIWIGKRYYKREDTHINDFYYYNVSGTGTGIDTLTVGPGKLNLAWTRTDRDGDDVNYQLKDGYSQEYDEKGNKISGPDKLKVNYFDTRYEFPAWNDATIQLGATYVKPEKDKKGYNKAFTTDKEFGDAINLSVELNQGFAAGWNKSIFQAFLGSTARDANWGSSARVYGDTGAGYRFINTGDTHITERFGFQHVVNAAYSTGSEYDKDFKTNFDNCKSLSVIVRPFYQLTKMTRLVAEAGAYVEKTKYEDGSHLTKNGKKYTLAYAIAPDASNFWSRPELRFYVSYVHGSNTNDKVGPKTKSGYMDKTSDLMFGAQVEAWW